jgi:fermentation-respiration switch protein FrsA (DUF1100 family)
MLVLFGGEDPMTSPDQIQKFADAVGDSASVVRFEQGGQADLWNIDRNRYEAAISQWLTDLLGPE